MKQNKTKNKHLSVRWVAGLASANGATGANSRTTSSPKATAIRSGLPSTRRPATWVTVPNGTPLHGARYTAIPSNYHQPPPPPQKKNIYSTNSQNKQTKQTILLSQYWEWMILLCSGWMSHTLDGFPSSIAFHSVCFLFSVSSFSLSLSVS